MKCQKCEKQATFHITEIIDEQVNALHFCSDCAEIYLQPGQTGGPGSQSVGSAIAKQITLNQTAEELAKLDKKACPVCGITFLEFRQVGRLGCPNDYQHFARELEPLIVNIHGLTEHKGKQPHHQPISAEAKKELIRLRREMKEAVEREDYESASKLRDQIRQLEQESQS